MPACHLEKKICFLLIEISRHKSFSRTKITLRLKMSIDLSGPTKSNIALIFGAILGIVSSITCFGFVLKKLKINHVIKKLLLVATVQQSLWYAISLVSILAFSFFYVNCRNCTWITSVNFNDINYKVGSVGHFCLYHLFSVFTTWPVVSQVLYDWSHREQ